MDRDRPAVVRHVGPVAPQSRATGTIRPNALVRRDRTDPPRGMRRAPGSGIEVRPCGPPLMTLDGPREMMPGCYGRERDEDAVSQGHVAYPQLPNLWLRRPHHDLDDGQRPRPRLHDLPRLRDEVVAP